MQPGTSWLNRAETTDRESLAGLWVVVHSGDRRWQEAVTGGRCSGTHGSTGNRTSWKRKEEEAAELVVKGGEKGLDSHSRRHTISSGGRTDGGDRRFPAKEENRRERGREDFRVGWPERRERGSTWSCLVNNRG